ncbi:MAG: AAA family ATPase, partial [Bacteroidales bacterium]|nr:AAA family ATPase [Bacteroidales bacterium]
METRSNISQTAPNREEPLSIKDIWNLCLSHWYWFAMAVAICLLAATFYILKTTPVYSRGASVLIKEDSKGRSVSADISSAFSDLGFGQTKVNVNNEIVNFKSPDLMLQVVKNLNLNINYKKGGTFHDWTLYGSQLPVNIEFLTLKDNESAALTITPKDSAEVILSDFILMKDKVGSGKVTAHVGDTVQTPVGDVRIVRTLFADDIDFDYPLYVTRSGLLASARSYANRLSATLNGKNTTVIDLGINDVNPRRAEEILQMVINVYNENWIKDKNQITTSTNEFIAERLRVIEDELGNVDKSITKYQSENMVPDVGAAATMEMQLSAEAGKHIMELNNQLSIARHLQTEIRNAGPSSLIPANVGISDPTVNSLVTQFNTTMLQRNRLAENSSEENYLVLDMDAQLSSLKSSILSSIDNYIVGLNTQMGSSRAAQGRANARVSSAPLQAGRLLSDERQQKVKEALYLFLLQKREENELSQAFTAYTTRVVVTPGGSNVPIAPNKKMILLLAFLLGLAIPFAILYLRETLNTSVRGRKDLENLSSPFLGELPTLYRRKNFFGNIKISDNPEDRKIVVKPHSRNMINEAFRVVRTNLEFMRGKDEGSKVVMFTSMNVGSGKTFSSINLATALAIKGKKVIVVDLDLRKRSLSDFAGQ